MTGLVGWMAMELELHSELAAQQIITNGDNSQLLLSTISCTLLVLDRQWSAGTGLPANFKENDIALAKPSLVRNRNMLASTSLSFIGWHTILGRDDAFYAHQSQIQ